MTVEAIVSKINVYDIIVEHVHSLRDASTSKTSTADLFVFYAVPAIAVAAMAIYRVKLTDSTITVLATALSILAGLLFNLLILLHSMQVPPRDADFDRLMKRFTSELHANIAYAIVVSLVTLVPLVVASYYGPNDLRRTVCGMVAVYLTVHFALTMAMVLKRMDAMLQQRMKPS
jgi:hypothetical protein